MEVAIALVVLGMLSSLLLETTQTIQKYQRTIVTQNHMETILASLAAYALRHAHLPLPDKDFFKDGSAYVGAVPCQELGLPHYVAKDGWNRPILYAVAENLTKTKTLMREEKTDVDLIPSFCNVVKGTLSIGATEDHETPNPSTLIAVFLYSSAGKPTSMAVFDETILKTEAVENGLFRWISRDVLMAAYGHKPCQQSEENAKNPAPEKLTESSRF
jgi:type II secretory pathway pseudopilin PulG